MKKLLYFSILFVVLSSSTLDLTNLYNYENQEVPNYISRDNSTQNPITDEGATLGRVLFYDKNLSTDLSTACASCHIQEFAFSDTSAVSLGANGVTGRHSMRLINGRFAEETKFFWDERAGTLEQQTTMPIRDHAEMGFSGANGDPSFSDLIDRLSGLPYYESLFTLVYGDDLITEERMQLALAQFVRSIQSFDSKFDEGRSMMPGPNNDFPNFTAQENLGRNLFNAAPEFDSEGNRTAGGAGCASCHRPPEFDIDPTSRANGVINEINGTLNSEIHRSPSLRDLFNPVTGELNGPLMHNAEFPNLETVIEHYGNLGENLSSFELQQLDTRLRVGPFGQKLNLTSEETEAMIAFVKTLSGNDVYENEKWSNPFDMFGNIEIVNDPLSIKEVSLEQQLHIYPNPAIDYVNLESLFAFRQMQVLNQNGQVVLESNLENTKTHRLDLSNMNAGIYYLIIRDKKGQSTLKKLIKLAQQ